MARAETDGEQIYLKATYADKSRAQEVPNSKWDEKRRMWRYPLSWATCVQLRGVFGDELDIGPGLLEWATDEKQRRVDPAMSAREEE